VWEIFLKTVPFFALIGCGYGAAISGLFRGEAVAHLTKFVFYFALSAMLFRFASSLSLQEIFELNFVLAYTLSSLVVYVLVTIVAMWRGISVAEAAVEAQCSVIANVGFLGLPMLVLLWGEAVAGPLLMLLTIDLILFGSLIVILITASRGKFGFGTFTTVLGGLVRNPMILAMIAGLAWSTAGLSQPRPMQEFLELMGAAATPCALFAIGASLAGRSAERVSVALWLSSAKLVLHPVAVAIAALVLFPVEPFAAAVMIACAAMPTAGNIYIIAQHYEVAPMRVSSTILVSTVISVVTLSLVIAAVSPI